MPNPLFGNRVSPNQDTQPNNPVNDAYKKYSRGYNRFNYSRTVYNTLRFADITPFEVVEGVEGDVLPFGNRHEIRTTTLSSPLMSDIFLKKNYFLTDMKALLPVNWEKVYKKPNKGDDVDESVNIVSKEFLRTWMMVLSTFTQAVTPPNLAQGSLEYTQNNYNLLWRLIFILESVYSNGSLLASLGCRLSSSVIVHPESDTYTDADSNLSFDKWLEDTLSHYTGTSSDSLLTVRFPSLSNKVFALHSSTTSIQVAPRTMFDMMRTYPNFEVWYTDNDGYVNSFNYLMKRLSLLDIRWEDSQDTETWYLNLSRPLAYQLCCTQFYVNDSVDNIYNTDLFMQNAKMVAMSAISTTSIANANNWPRFTYNGVKTDYDVFSGRIIDKVCESWQMYFNPTTQYLVNSQILFDAYNYLHMLLFYRKSLRYGDYFTGAKTRPLAVGDVTAEVRDSSVSAIDMTRATLRARFLNAVERVGNTWSDYLRGVMDGEAPPKDTEPRWLASSTHRVSGFEVENTADNQGNIVTLLKSQNSDFAYEVNVGSPCIIMAMASFEVPRVYSRTVDRFYHHYDRYDIFNKFLQNTGDQEISLNERNSAFATNRIFGYTLRYMEYKQRVPIACGGFVENLPGYAFITDNAQSEQNDIDFNETGLQISSAFIRHRNSEFDRFYSSLTGLTLASYFHFIVKFDNICDAKRMMEYTPSIL